MTYGDRVVVLPTAPDAPWSLAWPARSPDDVLDYALDARAWLAANGLALLGARAYASAGLGVGPVAYLLSEAGATVGAAVERTGGRPGTTATVELELDMSDGRTREVLVALPVLTVPAGLGPTDPSLVGAFAVGTTVITINGRPLGAA